MRGSSQTWTQAPRPPLSVSHAPWERFCFAELPRAMNTDHPAHIWHMVGTWQTLVPSPLSIPVSVIEDLRRTRNIKLRERQASMHDLASQQPAAVCIEHLLPPGTTGLLLGTGRSAAQQRSRTFVPNVQQDVKSDNMEEDEQNRGQQMQDLCKRASTLAAFCPAAAWDSNGSGSSYLPTCRVGLWVARHTSWPHGARHPPPGANTQ